MKKLFLLAFSLMVMLICPLVTNAAPKYWTHPEYDLSKVQTIIVEDIDVKSETGGNFVSEKNIPENITASIYAAAADKKILVTKTDDEITLPDNWTREHKKDRLQPTAVKLHITVNRLGYTFKTTPAHYENRIKYVKSQSTDSNGNTKEIQIPVPYQAYVPEFTHYIAYVEVIYDAYDPVSGQAVFNSRDFRYRDDTYGTSGMLKRTGKDFIKNIRKSK